MSELFKFLQKLPNSASVLVLFVALIILIVSKWDSIFKAIKWFSGKKNKKDRTCGDCVLILFGIREKYEYDRIRLDNDLLRSQMRFVEQKLQEIIFFLAQSFNDDIEKLIKKIENADKVKEAALYCEALKNSLLAVKDEIRRSFKENGFSFVSEVEFTQYVKEKTKTLLAISRTYLRQHYIETDSTIVTLNHRFEKMDNNHINKIEDYTFQIFTNAKDMQKDTAKKKKELSIALKKEIDSFVNGSSEVIKTC